MSLDQSLAHEPARPPRGRERVLSVAPRPVAPIAIVTRRRVDVVYAPHFRPAVLNRGPRREVIISLPRVARYFEEE